jgi:hypothetical protein
MRFLNKKKFTRLKKRFKYALSTFSSKQAILFNYTIYNHLLIKYFQQYNQKNLMI